MQEQARVEDGQLSRKDSTFPISIVGMNIFVEELAERMRRGGGSEPPVPTIVRHLFDKSTYVE